jgi:hypothetical protein
MGRKEQGIDWTEILRTGVYVGEIGMMACLVSLMKVAGAGSGFGAWLVLASAVSIGGGDVWRLMSKGHLVDINSFCMHITVGRRRGDKE